MYGKCLINCPVNEHGQFSFNKSEYKKMIGVTSLKAVVKYYFIELWGDKCYNQNLKGENYK